MEKVQLEITGIEYSQTHSGSYVLHLKEIHGNRHMPIVIGSFEAQAIAVELEKMVPNRPMTHDLFKPIFSAFNVGVQEVIIHQFREGLFIAKITLVGEDGIPTDIDSRSSDAVAIAVRFNVPIYTTKQVINEVNNISEGYSTGSDDEDLTNKVHESDLEEYLDEVSVDELEKQLEEALENEDYELASKIRDEINKRKK
ncbi:MAG: bifunctional nuclease domain-containing protein [Flavobacteriales bacterium]